MFLVIALFATLCGLAQSLPSCNILSLSGGGSFGAVEVGILDALIHTKQIPPTFDIITGVSAGGLNAAVLSYYDTIPTGLPLMINMYSTIRTADVYYSDIMNAQTAWSILNNAPLEKTMRRLLQSLSPPKYPPKVLIGASNLYTDELDIFIYNDLNFEDKMAVLMSSSAIPIVFPPRKFNGTLYIDGGLISNEIITQAIGFINCKYYNVTFISARAEYHVVKPTSFFTYVKTVINMLLHTFDSELSHIATKCTYPKGEINACYPTDEKLGNYSVLDFDHGMELYESGKEMHECIRYALC